EVLAAAYATGPAKVVRRINNSEMTSAASKIAEKLHLSGFFGLDFIIEERTGAMYLLEMNPRPTPLTHIRLGPGTDMVGALLAVLSGQSLPMTSPSDQNGHEVIAYFPQVSSLDDELPTSTVHDFPHGEPKLADALVNPFPQRTLLYRIV